MYKCISVPVQNTTDTGLVHVYVLKYLTKNINGVMKVHVYSGNGTFILINQK